MTDIQPGVDPASIPERAIDAAWAAGMKGARYVDEWGSDNLAAAIAAALGAMGCRWDDDGGRNTMRRIVGEWIEKP